MKKQRLIAKLKLTKKTISNLQQNSVLGGHIPRTRLNCPPPRTHTCIKNCGSYA